MVDPVMWTANCELTLRKYCRDKLPDAQGANENSILSLGRLPGYWWRAELVASLLSSKPSVLGLLLELAY
jgi:hypothetical protein